MTVRGNKARPWWVLFPLKGFELTDAKHDLKKPLFGDVSFVTKRHLEQIVPLLGLNKRMTPGHDHERDLLSYLQHMPVQEESQCFLAVKRSGITGPHGHTDEIREAAEKRAYEVASLLTLTCLCANKRGETCGLVEQLHRRSKSTAMLEIEDGNFVLQGGGGGFGRMIVDRRYNIKMSRSEIKRFLHQERFAGLADILLGQRSPIAPSLRNAVTQSALRLADAVHATATSSQILGAVTSVELLLGDLGDSFETLKNRLVALVGKEATDRYRVDDIFQARHRYVHKGEQLRDQGVSSRSTALAILSLLIYSDAARTFGSKLEIAHYLDFLASADRLPGGMSHDSRVFSLLAKQRRMQRTIAFA